MNRQVTLSFFFFFQCVCITWLLLGTSFGSGLRFNMQLYSRQAELCNVKSKTMNGNSLVKESIPVLLCFGCIN